VRDISVHKSKQFNGKPNITCLDVQFQASYLQLLNPQEQNDELVVFSLLT